MSRLTFEKTIKPGLFVAHAGDHSARVVAHVCNGRGVYGFDEETPDPQVEQALLRRSDAQVAKLIHEARELGA